MRIMHLQPVQAGESREVGDTPRWGHTVRQSRSERQPETVTGSLHFTARDRAYGVVKTIFPEFAGSEWCHTYCGIILPLSYGFEIIKKKEHRFERFFLRSGAFLYHFLEYFRCRYCQTETQKNSAPHKKCGEQNSIRFCNNYRRCGCCVEYRAFRINKLNRGFIYYICI